MNHPLPKHEMNAIENEVENAAHKPSPTWLNQNYREDDAEFLVNQYRRKQEEAQASAPPPENRTYEYYRRRILEKQREQTEVQLDRAPTTPMPAVPPRPTISSNELEGQHRYYGGARPLNEQPASHSTAGNPRLRKGLLFAGIFAAVAGGTVGFAVTKYDEISNAGSALLSYGGSLLASEPDGIFNATRETLISKKPIAIASLDVSDVTGTLNSMIPLALNAEPAFEDQKLAIKISGLPESAYLSAGTKLPDSTWLLKDGEENNINLFVSQADRAKIELSVAAIETSTGELAAPVKEMSVAIDDPNLETAPELQILPASAPPENSGSLQVKSLEAITDPQAAAPADSAIEPAEPSEPAVPAEVAGLLQKGDILMKSGDLIIARQFYSRAFQLGAAQGAMGVAKTYDPATFAELKVNGITPDAVKAAEWYEKAKVAGIPEADAALTTLSASAQ